MPAPAAVGGQSGDQARPELVAQHPAADLADLALGEVGELAEILPWRSDAELAALAQDNPAEWEHLGEELADVQIYLARLADVLGVDMAAAVADKLDKNARKYPEPQS